jgi:hypothetical protein
VRDGDIFTSRFHPAESSTGRDAWWPATRFRDERGAAQLDFAAFLQTTHATG